MNLRSAVPFEAVTHVLKPPGGGLLCMRAAVLVLCFLSSGCLGEEPAASSSAWGPSPGVPEPSPVEPSPPVVVPFQEQWVLGAGASVCPPQARSHCIAPVEGGAVGEQAWVDGLVRSFVANVSWTPASPVTESLRFFFGGCFGVEESYECETLATVEGRSPLAISLPSIAGSWNYYYAVVQMPEQATEPYAAWSLEQALVVDGRLVWERADPEPL